MTDSIRATYDGTVFHPDTPVALKPNTRVRIAVEEVQDEPPHGSFLRTAKSLNLDGPADWSEKLDDYLQQQDGEP